MDDGKRPETAGGACVFGDGSCCNFFCVRLYAWIGMRIDEDVYYRVLWSLPMGILVCYSAVKLMTRWKTLLSKGLVFILTILLIMMNGKFVYANTLHFKSVNLYHIPQQVIDVADALKLDNYRPIAVLPAELLPFFRQYTADIYTPYGRNILEPAWTFQNELYDAMEGNNAFYDVQEVARCARDEHCAFVVLSCAKQMRAVWKNRDIFCFALYRDIIFIWIIPTIRSTKNKDFLMQM